MAVTAALMVHCAVHAFQATTGHSGPRAESIRSFAAAGAACFAVYVPFVMMMLGFSHSAAWGVWALLFGSLGAMFGVVAFVVFFDEDLLLGQPGLDLTIAVAFVLLGLGFTVHSFIPGLCTGWRTTLPLHALWHVCSSITASRCGRMLDTLAQVIESIEQQLAEGGRSNRKAKISFLRLITRDGAPSQFSM
jgi:hypothetical protein